MKKNLLKIGAAALAILVAQQSAQATLVSSGTANFVSTSSGTVAVNYNVSLISGIYTYVYSFNPGVDISSFTVNASDVLNVLTAGVTTALGVTTDTATQTFGPPINQTITYVDSSVNATTVAWYFIPESTTTQVVGFTSDFGPGVGSGSLIDSTSGPWGDNNGSGSPIPVPTAVPEASTVMAGALMLLPFGIGAIRSLRKERNV